MRDWRRKSLEIFAQIILWIKILLKERKVCSKWNGNQKKGKPIKISHEQNLPSNRMKALFRVINRCETNFMFPFCEGSQWKKPIKKTMKSRETDARSEFRKNFIHFWGNFFYFPWNSSCKLINYHALGARVFMVLQFSIFHFEQPSCGKLEIRIFVFRVSRFDQNTNCKLTRILDFLLGNHILRGLLFDQSVSSLFRKISFWTWPESICESLMP